MISRLSDPNHGISIITDPSEDNEDIQYCNECSEYRKKNVRLGPFNNTGRRSITPRLGELEAMSFMLYGHYQYTK